MKALTCTAFGPLRQLQLAELPEPQVGPGQVLIEVAAVGVNFLDTLIVQGRYQLKPTPPFAPGAEVSGIVTGLGAGVTSLRTGQRVVALLPYGGFSERVVARCDLVYPIADTMTFPEAAAFLVAGGTAYHALHRRADVRKDETLLVLGAAGGVGLAAVDIGRLLGARVIAAASTPDKLALCMSRGAEDVIDYRVEDLGSRLKQISGGLGIDVVYDPVGGSLAQAAIRNLSFFGRYLVVGFASNEIPAIAANVLLLKSASALGIAWGAFAERFPAQCAAEVRTLMTWCSEGKLRPCVSAIYPFERSKEALEVLANRQALGKIVVQLREGAE